MGRHRAFQIIEPLAWLLAAVVASMLLLTPPLAAAPAGVVDGSSGVVLESNKGTVLRLSRPAVTVFVADPDICDIQVKSPRLVYLMGKKPGQTTLYAVDAHEALIASVPITVSHNLSRLSSAVHALYPGLDVNAESVEGSVVLEGNVANPTVAESIRDFAASIVGKDGRIINRLGVAGPTQVNLRVRVAEISRDIEKQLGINWSAIFQGGGTKFMMSAVNPFAGALMDTLGLSGSTGGWDLNAVLDLLDNQGLINVLAEPNLTALSGETASFLAGGEFPILVPQGNDQVTIEFKKFGVSLSFTPTIVGNSRINLHVRPEVSRLSDEGAIDIPIGGGQTIRVPALQTRRAETTVELGSGQSFAIAGLLSNDVAHDVHKFPGLGDIPILGRLFTSDRFQRKETELVIIVTPYIARPSPVKLAAPNDGFQPPNDLERVFPGGVWKRNPVPGQSSAVLPDGERVFDQHGFALD
jgi:pilus assembly protein CpaC